MYCLIAKWIQERGEILFFYRPKVEREEAHSADDVQRLYIVLRPESGERAVEEKQAPDSGKEGEKRSKSDEEGDGDEKKVEHVGDGSEGGHGNQVLIRKLLSSSLAKHTDPCMGQHR